MEFQSSQYRVSQQPIKNVLQILFGNKVTYVQQTGELNIESLQNPILTIGDIKKTGYFQILSFLETYGQDSKQFTFSEYFINSSNLEKACDLFKETQKSIYNKSFDFENFRINAEPLLQEFINNHNEFNKVAQNNDKVGINCGCDDEKPVQKCEPCYLGTKSSLEEFVLYETLKMVVEYQDSNQDKLSHQLKQFFIEIELLPFLQPYLFSKETMLQDFLPGLDSLNRKIAEVSQANLDTILALANQAGAQYLYQDQNQKEYTDHVPFSCRPFPLRKNEILDFKSKAQLWNKVLNNMASDDEFIQQTFQNMSDEFLLNHIKIWQKVKTVQHANQLNVTVTRNDVMFDAKSQQWYQIEYNAQATSFPHISDTVQDLQQALKNTYYRDELKQFEQYKDQNGTLIADGIEQAHQIYGNPRAAVIIVVEGFDGNSYDIRYVEYELLKKGIMTHRKTLTELSQEGKTLEDGTLLVNDEEIAVVYYRSGYAPTQYKTQDCWDAREMIECSKAIKSPNIRLALINFKKAQQAIQDKDILRRFVDNEEELKLIQDNFVKIYDFEDPVKGEELVKLASQNIDDYVLKPQREGGANNYYGADVCKQLCFMDAQERKNYILMQKIKPQPTCGFLIKKRQLNITASICELGIFGTFIGEGRNIKYNQIGGYLVRSKKYFENEGGVASGYAVIDSIMHQKEQ